MTKSVAVTTRFPQPISWATLPPLGQAGVERDCLAAPSARVTDMAASRAARSNCGPLKGKLPALGSGSGTRCLLLADALDLADLWEVAPALCRCARRLSCRRARCESALRAWGGASAGPRSRRVRSRCSRTHEPRPPCRCAKGHRMVPQCEKTLEPRLEPKRPYRCAKGHRPHQPETQEPTPRTRPISARTPQNGWAFESQLDQKPPHCCKKAPGHRPCEWKGPCVQGHLCRCTRRCTCTQWCFCTSGVRSRCTGPCCLPRGPRDA